MCVSRGGRKERLSPIPAPKAEAGEKFLFAWRRSVEEACTN